MRRSKGKLFALILMLAAVGAVAATGAFSVVEAERTATLDTAGDSSALLAIDPVGPYAESTSGTVEINFASQGASGLNLNAMTDFGTTINLTNQGTQSVDVYVQMDDSSSALTQTELQDNVAFYVGSGNYTGTAGTELSYVTSSSNVDSTAAVITDGSNSETTAITLNAGETVSVGLLVDLRGLSLTDSDSVLSDFTIVADSDSGADVDSTVTPG